MTAIEKILSDYEAGTITERERVVALARLITPETVEATFASLPREVGEELLDWASAVPLEGGVMIGGELSREAGRKLAEQLRGAVLAIRSWMDGRESHQGNGTASQPSEAIGSRGKAE
jgi:hypothetical protein